MIYPAPFVGFDAGEGDEAASPKSSWEVTTPPKVNDVSMTTTTGNDVTGTGNDVTGTALIAGLIFRARTI